MVYQKEALCLPYHHVAQNLNVDPSTAKRTVKQTVKLVRQTGDVAKKVYPRCKSAREITRVVQFFLLEVVLTNPGIYFHEIHLKIQKEFYLTVACSTICRFLHGAGFTQHQSLKVQAIHQNEELRLYYCTDVSLYHNVFIDDSGCDQRNLIRKERYGIRESQLLHTSCLLEGNIYR